MSIAVIIVSYNTRDLLLRCLATLCENLGQKDTEVWVVDNGSTDRSCDVVADSFPQVRILANRENCGFGAANNKAIARCTGRYVLLLNSDAFLRPGAVERLVRYLDEHPRAAVVGPKLLNAAGTLQPSCYRFPTPARAWVENLWLSGLVPADSRYGDHRLWNHDRERLVDWVVGACLLVRHEAVEEVGGFDEQFFMYSEETDWQKRMSKAGWEIGFTPRAEVTHLGGGSGTTEQARVSEDFFRSLDRYVMKHHGFLGLSSFRLAMIVGCVLRVPLWVAGYILRPALRPLAASKIRLRVWLMRRLLLGLLWNPGIRRDHKCGVVRSDGN